MARPIVAFLALLPLALITTSCGVKAPPVAPQRPPEAAAPAPDCSPRDPDCDVTDPDYVPQRTKRR